MEKTPNIHGTVKGTLLLPLSPFWKMSLSIYMLITGLFSYFSPGQTDFYADTEQISIMLLISSITSDHLSYNIRNHSLKTQRPISCVNHVPPTKMLEAFYHYKLDCSQQKISYFHIFSLPLPPKYSLNSGTAHGSSWLLLRKALNTPCSTAGGSLKAVEIGGWIEKAWDHNYTPLQWHVWSCSDSRQRHWSVQKLIFLQDRPKNICWSCRLEAITKSTPQFSCWEPKMPLTRLQQAVWLVVTKSEGKSFASLSSVSL